MKTLIVHPSDPSTDFLKPVYSKIPDCRIISGGITKAELKQHIELYDSIIMCGHGSPDGLFAIGQFKDIGYADYIIDSSFAPFLFQKKIITIWCYAKSFVETNNLNKAYFSDMFISEVAESIYCGLEDVTQEQVDESNFCFSDCLSSIVHLEPAEIHENMIKSEYAKLAKTNPVAEYNFPKLGIALFGYKSGYNN